MLRRAPHFLKTQPRLLTHQDLREFGCQEDEEGVGWGGFHHSDMLFRRLGTICRVLARIVRSLPLPETRLESFHAAVRA